MFFFYSKGVVSPSKLHALVFQGGVKCAGISFQLRKIMLVQFMLLNCEKTQSKKELISF